MNGKKQRTRSRNVPETKRLVLGSAFSLCRAVAAADGGKLKGGIEVEKKRLKPRGAAAAAVLKAITLGLPKTLSLSSDLWDQRWDFSERERERDFTTINMGE